MERDDIGVELRAMRVDDLDRVVELERAIFPNPWPRDFFKIDLHRPNSFNFVAELEGSVVGYIVAWGENELHLANLAVAPKSRRQGIGRKLVVACEGFARSVGARSLYLEVRESNMAARRFYENSGFVQICVRKSYYENGENAIIMNRNII